MAKSSNAKLPSDPKRNMFAELMEGIAALKAQRLGLRTLRTLRTYIAEGLQKTATPRR